MSFAVLSRPRCARGDGLAAPRPSHAFLPTCSPVVLSSSHATSPVGSPWAPGGDERHAGGDVSCHRVLQGWWGAQWQTGSLREPLLTAACHLGAFRRSGVATLSSWVSGADSSSSVSTLRRWTLTATATQSTSWARGADPVPGLVRLSDRHAPFLPRVHSQPGDWPSFCPDNIAEALSLSNAGRYSRVLGVGHSMGGAGLALAQAKSPAFDEVFTLLLYALRVFQRLLALGVF